MKFPQGNQEGLNFLRFILALGSFSPLFVLWAVKGVSFLHDGILLLVCGILTVGPSYVLFWHERNAKRQKIRRPLKVGRVENQSGQILVYLFAVLLPFYSQDVDSGRDLSAFILALAFIVYLFWQLNLYYINILFALRGYRIFTVHPPHQENEFASLDSFILITRRKGLLSGQEIVGLRLSNTVYLEESNEYQI